MTLQQYKYNKIYNSDWEDYYKKYYKKFSIIEIYTSMNNDTVDKKINQWYRMYMRKNINTFLLIYLTNNENKILQHYLLQTTSSGMYLTKIIPEVLMPSDNILSDLVSNTSYENIEKNISDIFDFLNDNHSSSGTILDTNDILCRIVNDTAYISQKINTQIENILTKILNKIHITNIERFSTFCKICPLKKECIVKIPVQINQKDSISLMQEMYDETEKHLLFYHKVFSFFTEFYNFYDYASELLFKYDKEIIVHVDDIENKTFSFIINLAKKQFPKYTENINNIETAFRNNTDTLIYVSTSAWDVINDELTNNYPSKDYEIIDIGQGYSGNFKITDKQLEELHEQYNDIIESADIYNISVDNIAFTLPLKTLHDYYIPDPSNDIKSIFIYEYAKELIYYLKNIDDSDVEYFKINKNIAKKIANYLNDYFKIL